MRTETTSSTVIGGVAMACELWCFLVWPFARPDVLQTDDVRVLRLIKTLYCTVHVVYTLGL